MLKTTRLFLSDCLIESKCDKERFLIILKEAFKIPPKSFVNVKRNLEKTFIPQFLIKWKKAKRMKTRFYKIYKAWLESEIVINKNNELKEENCAGRPKKILQECSERSKRRKISEIDKKYKFTIAELQALLERKLRQEGKIKEASLIHEVLSTGADEFRRQFQKQQERFSSNEALSIMTDTKLSRYQYNHIREKCLSKEVDLFPTYRQIFKAKSECYPLNMQIFENEASIPLQNLLDHTIKRLFLVPSVQRNADESHSKSFILNCKWGCDGSSGNGIYKQNFRNINNSDESVFIASLVPIQLTTSDNILIWKNPHPSSTNYCRPMYFSFLKETPDVIKSVVNKYKIEIDNLNNTKIVIQSQEEITVSYQLSLTMIDGKVCQVLTETSSAACCTICKAKPTEMNDLKKIRLRTVDKNAYKYGLSSLHALIRFMECILNISYRLEFKKWSARSEDEKNSVKRNKKRVQDGLKEKLAIIVDVPRQGSGSSNDGNTARTFFKNVELVSEITRVDKDLITRFGIILQVLVCGKAINTNRFQIYAQNTAELYIKKYSWYYMPSSVHKILLHGSEIIESACLPIGQLSEEAAEARNKDFKRLRLMSSRKCSRVATNEDILHGLLISSDPYLTSLRKSWNRLSVRDMDQAAQNLLMA